MTGITTVFCLNYYQFYLDGLLSDYAKTINNGQLEMHADITSS